MSNNSNLPYFKNGPMTRNSGGIFENMTAPVKQADVLAAAAHHVGPTPGSHFARF